MASIRPFWLMNIILGMCTHLNQWCASGLYHERLEILLKPTASSVIFCFAVSCLVSEYDWWPCGLKRPHVILQKIHQMLANIFMVDFTMRSFYAASLTTYKWLFHILGEQMKAYSSSLPKNVYEVVVNNPDTMVEGLSTFVALFLLGTVIYVTDRHEDIEKFFKQLLPEQKKVTPNMIPEKKMESIQQHKTRR